MDTSLRESGLSAVGAVAWGTHACHFYATADDLVETLVPYVKAGLDRNERCLWVTSEPVGADDARAALASASPRLADQLASGQMVILQHAEWYARCGRFGDHDAVDGLLREEGWALSHGFSGLRATGNTSWLVDQPSWDAFADYEADLNARMARRSVLVLCSYSTDRCSCESVFDVVRNHQLALVRRRGEWEVIENAALKLAKEELRRANAELEQRVAERTLELEAALRARDEFLGMASHELKTPLSALLLQLEGLARPGKLGAGDEGAVRERLNKALANGRRLAALVGRMLDISRLGQGLVPVDVQAVDLGALAREVLARLADPLQASSATVTLREHGAVVGTWDRSRLDQVLTNLITNAMKHARGTPIEVDVGLEAGAAVVRVRDHGPGVAAADRSRIFERFVQLGGARAEGFGLGLWMVRQIVGAHGGSVVVEDPEGGGARFVVRLPLRPWSVAGGDA